MASVLVRMPVRATIVSSVIGVDEILLVVHWADFGTIRMLLVTTYPYGVVATTLML